MSQTNSILEKRQKQLNTLLKKYKVAFYNVRLDYNVVANTDYSTDRQKHIMEVRNIENQINNVYLDLLRDVGIDEHTQTSEIVQESNQINNVKRKQNRHSDLHYKLNKHSYVKNSAFVRKEITEFRMNREKICLASLTSMLFLFSYVFFRDIKQVDKILFHQNASTQSDK